MPLYNIARRSMEAAMGTEGHTAEQETGEIVMFWLAVLAFIGVLAIMLGPIGCTAQAETPYVLVAEAPMMQGGDNIDRRPVLGLRLPPGEVERERPTEQEKTDPT